LKGQCENEVTVIENIYYKNQLYYTTKRQLYRNSRRFPLQCTEYRT